jgi:hypothetical protein
MNGKELNLNKEALGLKSLDTPSLDKVYKN